MPMAPRGARPPGGAGAPSGATAGREGGKPARSISTRCVPWKTDADAVDKWWSSHPAWELGPENTTHACFQRVEPSSWATMARALHRVQNQQSCANVVTRQMWSEGWGAGFRNVAGGLQSALRTSRPFAIKNKMNEWGKGRNWQYAVLKNGSGAVCPAKDMSCFFLPLGRCAATSPPIPFNKRDWISMKSPDYWLLYTYATRPRHWLRRRIYAYTTARAAQFRTPCAAIHVRRSDVVLHGTSSRPYHPLSTYLAAAAPLPRNIWLLTDDQDAVEEAHRRHPSYNWIVLDRARHRGASGGWENHVPSGDPASEVVVILSTLRLVRACSVLVHSHSNFASLLALAMCSSFDASPRLMACLNRPPALRVVNIDVTGRDGVPEKHHVVKTEKNRRKVGYRMVVE